MELHVLFILLSVSDLPTVRQFLLKQTQLKGVMFGELTDVNMDLVTDSDTDSDTDSNTDSDTDIKDTEDTTLLITSVNLQVSVSSSHQ